MSNGIEVGSTVVLKSGGPTMTVSDMGQKLDEDVISVWCDWFMKNAEHLKRKREFSP